MKLKDNVRTIAKTKKHLYNKIMSENTILEKILDEVQNLKKGQQRLEVEVQSLKKGQQRLEVEVQSLKKGQQRLEVEVQSLKKGQQRLQINVEDLKTEQQKQGKDISEIKQQEDTLEIKVSLLQKFEKESHVQIVGMLVDSNEANGEEQKKLEKRVKFIENHLQIPRSE